MIWVMWCSGDNLASLLHFPSLSLKISIKNFPRPVLSCQDKLLPAGFSHSPYFASISPTPIHLVAATWLYSKMPNHLNPASFLGSLAAECAFSAFPYKLTSAHRVSAMATCVSCVIIFHQFINISRMHASPSPFWVLTPALTQYACSYVDPRQEIALWK